MAKINHVTKKTENPFLNFYELDRESKTGKKGKYYVASRAKDESRLKLNTKKNHPDGVIIYSLYGGKNKTRWFLFVNTATVLMIIFMNFRQAWWKRMRIIRKQRFGK